MDELRIRSARWVRMSSGLPRQALVEELEPRAMLSLAQWDGGPLGTGTDWNDPQNWMGDVLPVNGDDAVIDSGAGVRFTGGSLSLHSLTSSVPFSILAGTLGVTDTASVSAQVTLDGGVMEGGVWMLSGPGLAATPNTANGLSGVTINGDVALDADGATARVTGGLTINGLISMQGDGAAIVFAGGAQTFSGNADVMFAGFSGLRSISADDGAVLTLGSSVSFTGERGRITSGLVSGSGSVVNTGTIWADTDGGSIEVSPSVFANTGTLRATGNGTLSISAGNWTNSGIVSINGGTIGLGGTLDVTAGIGTFNRNGGTVTIDGTILNTGGTLTLNGATGSWQFHGGQIIGGTVSLAGGASLLAFPLTTGRIAQATVNGNLSWLISNFTAEFDGVTLNGSLTLSGFSSLTVTHGLVLNGTLSVTGDETQVFFDGPAQAITGNASILLRDESLFFWAQTPLTLSAGVNLSGYGQIFGSVTNQGHVTADTSGKILTFGRGSFLNSGTLTVVPGAKVDIGERQSGSPAAQFTNTGTISASGGSRLSVGPGVNPGSASLTNSGDIALASNSRLDIGISAFQPNIPITVGNSGTIEVAGGSTMTIGVLFTPAPPVTFNNTGIIQATGAGVISVVSPATTAQLGDLRAGAGGGIVKLRGSLDNTGATLLQNATTGAWTVSGATIAGGVLELSAGVWPIFDNQLGNTLSGVQINGSLTLAQSGARLRIVNGLTLFGTMTISGADAAVAFDGGAQLVTGKAHILLAGGKGFQTLSADEGAVVTLDVSVSITGTTGSGQLVSGYVLGGTGSFVSNGTVSGNVTLNVSGGFTNSGTVQAASGDSLSVQGSVTNYAAGVLTGGTWRVSSGSSIVFAPGPITMNHANIILDGAGSTLFAASSLVSNMGSLTLSGGRDLALTGDFANTGALDLGPGSDLVVSGAFAQSAAGTTTLEIASSAYPTVVAGAGATLDGGLAVSWLGGYHPGDGTAITFLSGASVTGTFSTFSPQSLGTNRRQFLTYSATSAVLNVWAVWRDD